MNQKRSLLEEMSIRRDVNEMKRELEEIVDQKRCPLNELLIGRDGCRLEEVSSN